MTPQERARLIERLESYEKYGNADEPMWVHEVVGLVPAILSDLSRLDVLEKALRPFADAVSFAERDRLKFGGKVGDYPFYHDYISDDEFKQAKQALGDA